jgi:hypothetical protein
MTSESAFGWEKARQIADRVAFRHFGEHLKDVELAVLQEAWKGSTYERMSETLYLSVNYLRGDVGPKLWGKLSDALGEEVTKNNFKGALERAWRLTASSVEDNTTRSPASVPARPPFPEGSVPLNSPFYVEREGVESICYEAIARPGALARIKAPNLMGKTSLLLRILARGESLNYRSAYIDLNCVERSIVANLDKFLRWLCVSVGNQLKLENRCRELWDTEILGSNDNCTVYFEEYLLKEIGCPLVLGIDNVERVFPHSEVVEDFFAMLRSWHEKGKIREPWQQLRLVMAHSTECYVPLNVNQSPFNAGIPVTLSEFDRQQVRVLADRYRLSWSDREIGSLVAMVGSHPYLVALALYEIATGKITLEKLLEEAATEVGIYSDHLRGRLEILQRAPELAIAFQQVVSSPEPIELGPVQIYKLHSTGLVHQRDNQVLPRCQLYRDYFARVLSGKEGTGLAEMSV